MTKALSMTRAKKKWKAAMKVSSKARLASGHAKGLERKGNNFHVIPENYQVGKQ